MHPKFPFNIILILTKLNGLVVLLENRIRIFPQMVLKKNQLWFCFSFISIPLPPMEHLFFLALPVSCFSCSLLSVLLPHGPKYLLLFS